MLGFKLNILRILVIKILYQLSIYDSDIFMWLLNLTMAYMKYRDRNEIIAQILESANGNRVRLTKIMYEVYLSHTLTKEYVRLLIKKGLIEYLDGERTFKTSEKGMNFLRIHDRVQGLIAAAP
ncbi:MAG TPA: winged helix-turn-helix domain-containing protein, partial [Candidatus Bathyarchaeia archaeon]|nr:winged helix-turn-helix domain-containing protein [Candidatus Bathyarchaeia archaeon]